jgi:hypothetical protein
MPDGHHPPVAGRAVAETLGADRYPVTARVAVMDIPRNL